MSANFTPVFGGYREPGAFKFWCQKVLPLVYDDSLSYYELLCKVVDYINNLIHDNSETIDNMDALLTAYNQLQDYVNNYFANLDLTGEVSDKIDEMADNGELLAIIQPTLDAMGQYLVEQSEAQQTYNEQTRADVTASIANQTAYNTQTRTDMNTAIEQQNAYNTQTRTQVGASINEQNAYNAQTRGMLSAAYNAPIPVTSTAMIPNGDNIVVWIGETAGDWKNGYWYYVSKSGGSIVTTIEGGVYQATATELDRSLNIPDVAADAGSVGVRLRQFAPRQSWTSNYRLNPSTGAAESYTGQSTEHAITGFIDCADISDILGFDYTSGLGGIITCSVFIYDENSTYLGYIHNSAQYGYVSPSGTQAPLASAPAFQKIRFDVNITTYTYEQFPYAYQDIMTMRRIGTDKSLKAINVPADSGVVGGEITQLKSGLNGVESAVGFEILFPEINKSININTGVVLPSNVVTENGFCCLCVPCVENDAFTVTGKGGNNTQLWGFADSNGTVITKSGAGKTESNLKITAPTGSAYFAFNSSTNVDYGVAKGVSPVEKIEDIYTEISELQTQVESVKNDLYEQTVILTDNSLHPFPLANGTTIVITTTDGTTLPEGNPYLQCYDSDNTYLGQFLCSSAYGTLRTVTISFGNVASVKMYAVPSKAIKVYVPDNSKLIPKVEEIANIVGQNTIIVDSSGSGDYASFTEAIYDTVDSGRNVYVKPGTYNIVAEYVALFGQSAVDSMADADSAIFNGFQYGVRLRNRKVEFAPGAHLVCNWTGHTVDGTHRFSALGVDYNVEIIGLDLDATGTFYCIHDDYGIATPYTVKYENCRVVGHSIYNADCIGGGCKKYSRHILKNCYFDNNLTASATVRYHNTNAEGAEPEIYVSNCYFNNWFTPRWYGTQTSKMRVYVNNCHARAIYKMAESSSYNVDNVELYKWCNTETNPVN